MQPSARDFIWQDSLETLEVKAAVIESRLQALEAAGPHPAGSSDKGGEYLPVFLELRQLLEAAHDEVLAGEQERQQLLDKHKELEKKAGKLQYQVLHLKRAVHELEGRGGSA